MGYDAGMRLALVPITANTEIRAGVHLLEVHAPLLAQTVQPGQYCMLRCCDSFASDPLLRRPFFMHEAEPARGLCRFLVYTRGRASAWLARQQPGMSLDILGPLGHGWTLPPEGRNLLLIGEEPVLASLIFLAHHALEHELTVTLLHVASSMEASYPAALLPPEIEYQVMVGQPGPLQEYLRWADTVCCAVSRETLQTFSDPRWREKHFAQAVLWPVFACGSGICLSCQTEMRHSPRLVCREGPIFALSELAET